MCEHWGPQHVTWAAEEARGGTCVLTFVLERGHACGSLGWSKMCWGSERSCRFHCLSRSLFHRCVPHLWEGLGILEKQLSLSCDC